MVEEPMQQEQQQEVNSKPVYTLGDIEFNEANQIMAVLACIPLLNIFLLLTERNDKFVRYMAAQSLILSLFYLLAWLPAIGWVISLIITIILAAMITMVITGKRFDFPIVSGEALKLMSKI